MVTACHAAGVKVYVDAVINHMTGQGNTSYGGTTFSKYSYPGLYGPGDFHHYPANCPEPDGQIHNYGVQADVQECELVGLSDLYTETDHVRATIAGYLNDLLGIGVDGFRVDSAKHLNPADLAAVEARLTRPAYLYQEVIYGAGEAVQPSQYEATGDLLEFRYGTNLKAQFNGDIANLSTFGASWGMEPSTKAVVFVDNHDTERNGSTLSYKDGATYVLADIFELAWNYGTPDIMSSFTFTGTDDSPPANANGYVTAPTCGAGWQCQHRTRAVANMVGFHNAVKGTAIANWSDDGANLVAFSRGTAGWVTINNGTGAQTRTFVTGLAPGTYCDVIHGDYANGTCGGPTVTVNGSGTATVTVAAKDAVAIDGNARISGVGPTTNVAAGAPASASSTNGAFVASNMTDTDPSTYWESTNGVFPQWAQVDLGQNYSVGKVVLKLPPSWGARTETLSLSGSTDGSTFSTIAGSAGYLFDPNANGNTVTITFNATTARYVRATVTANSGWSAGQVSDFEVFPAAGGSAVLSASPTSLTFGSQAVNTTSAAQTVTVTNAGTASVTVSSVTTTGDFLQTNTCGTPVPVGGSCTVGVSFRPTASGTRTGSVSVASNASNTPTVIASTGTGASTTNTNLAAGKATSESSHTDVYPSANVTDGNPSTYWESVNNAFPQWVQVDLGSAQSAGRVVLALPASWGMRNETLSLLSSTDGTTFSTLKASATYTFNPTSGNTATITFTPTTQRYFRVNISANTGWPAGQLSEFQVWNS
jgi:hypothetical protein